MISHQDPDMSHAKVDHINVVDWDDNYENPMTDYPAWVVINLKTGEIVRGQNLLKIIVATCVLPVHYLGFYSKLNHLRRDMVVYYPDSYYREKNT